MFRHLYNANEKVTAVLSRVVSRDKLTVEEGTIYDRIQGQLGEDEYVELSRDSALELVAICYCQTELRRVGASLQASRELSNPDFDENLEEKRLLNHDSLLLKLQPGVPGRPAIYITAEKVASAEDSKAGIYIGVHGDEAEDFERRCCLLRIECCTQISLPELTAILKKQSPGFDVIHSNCWHYAVETTEFLLDACIKREWEGSEDHSRLVKELKDLKANIVKQHAVNTGKRMENAKSHLWHEIKSHV